MGSTQLLRDAPPQKKTGKWGNFKKTGGGVYPNPTSFVSNLTKWFVACQIHSEVVKHVFRGEVLSDQFLFWVPECSFCKKIKENGIKWDFCP